MKRYLMIAALAALPMALSALRTGSSGSYGTTGFFLTPMAEVQGENDFALQALWMQEPEENIQLFGAPLPMEGEVLFGGSLAFGMGGGFEAGWSFWNIGPEDMHHFGVKWQFANDEVDAWGNWAVGAAATVTAAKGDQETDFLGYLVGSFPFTHGDFSLGAGWVREETGDFDWAVFGSASIWLTERVRFWYEGTSATPVHGDVGHGGGFAWQVADQDPVWVWAGATQFADYGVVGPTRTDEWMFTAGVAIGINSHHTYDEEETEEEVEIFETFGRP